MKATCVRSRPQRGEEDHSHSQDKGREWEADSWEADTQLQTEAGIWLMTRAWCAQALIHDISMERRSINANPAPSQSHREKLWPCQKKVASTPDPRLSFSTNPSVRPALLHPSLPVSTAFAFSSRIKPLSLSFAPFPSPQPPHVTLSHVSIPSFNTQFASNTSRLLPLRSQCAKGQAVKPSQTLCLIWIVLPESRFQFKEKTGQAGVERTGVWEGSRLGRWHVDWCSAIQDMQRILQLGGRGEAWERNLKFSVQAGEYFYSSVFLLWRWHFEVVVFISACFKAKTIKCIV